MGTLQTLRRFAPDALAALFLVSGSLHLVRPAAYEALIPPGIPAPGTIIALSGVAELVCGLALVRRTAWAGPASAALLVAIFPGNVWFALAATADPVASPTLVAASWLRLPLQALLIGAAIEARRQPRVGLVDRIRAQGQTPNDR